MVSEFQEFHNLFESKRIDPLVYILPTFGTLGNLCTCALAQIGKNSLLSPEYNNIDVLHERHVLKKTTKQCDLLEQFYKNISCFIGALKLISKI